MNELQQSYQFLNQAMADTPLLCLAQTVAWLDPLWLGFEEDNNFEFDEDGILLTSLLITRRAFPTIYADAVELLRQNATYAAVDQLICKGITAAGIPIEHLEHLPYGIPLPAYGALLDEPEFYEHHPDVIPIVEAFGIFPEPNNYGIDIPKQAYTAAEMIATHLKVHPDERYQQVAWTLLYLFNSSNNSCVDWHEEMMWEVQPLAWEDDDIDFAHALIEEAEEIMNAVWAGLHWLLSEPTVLQALQNNIQKIYQTLKERGNTDEIPDIRLQWPDFTNSADRAA